MIRLRGKILRKLLPAIDNVYGILVTMGLFGPMAIALQRKTVRGILNKDTQRPGISYKTKGVRGKIELTFAIAKMGGEYG